MSFAMIGKVSFGMSVVGHANLEGSNLFYSDSESNNNYYRYLRPAISLGRNIKVIRYEGETSSTDTNKMHTLSKIEV